MAFHPSELTAVFPHYYSISFHMCKAGAASVAMSVTEVFTKKKLHFLFAFLFKSSKIGPKGGIQNVFPKMFRTNHWNSLCTRPGTSDHFHSSPSAFLLAPPFPPSPILPHPLLCYFHLYMFAIIRFFCVFNTCIQWDSEEEQLYLQSRRFQNRNLSLLLCLTPGWKPCPSPISSAVRKGFIFQAKEVSFGAFCFM